MKWFDDSNPLYPKGTEVCRHPFFDTLSFYGASRRSPLFIPPDRTPIPNSAAPECFCAFCMGRTKEATPDKTRTLCRDGLVRRIPYPKLARHDDTLFRRQGNLFEIIPFEYWRLKYGLDSTPAECEAMDSFFEDPETKDYLLEMIRMKYSRIQKTYSESDLKEEAKPFFSGFHELLTSGWHFQPGAKDKSGLFTSGNCSWQEHRVAYEDLALIHGDMVRRNPHISYISTFQNWLALAGASFEHWHKQILAADFWGRPLMRERGYFRERPDAYARFALDTAVENDFILAENAHALALLEVGSKSGLVSVVSKSARLRPHEMAPEELYAVSDLAHALSACLGPSTPYNEEWMYTPMDAADFRTPWRVLLHLRTGTPAGFENINQYLVGTVSQRELAENLRTALAALPGKAPGIEVVHGGESHKKSLQYLG